MKEYYLVHYSFFVSKSYYLTNIFVYFIGYINFNLIFFLQIVLRHSEHPPIMKDPSWTRAAPFKETAFARTPSESIANNYTPSASNLKMKNLSKMQNPVRPLSRTPTQSPAHCILLIVVNGNAGAEFLCCFSHALSSFLLHRALVKSVPHQDTSLVSIPSTDICCFNTCLG